MTGQVLFLDDDADVREAYGQALELAGFDVTTCRAWIEAADHLRPGWPGVVVTDVKMPGRDGFDVIARVHKLDPELPVIVVTGHADVPMAVRAMRAGASDFLEKPCSAADLVQAAKQGVADRAQTLRRRKREAGKVTAPLPYGSLAGRMAEVEKQMIIGALEAHDGQAARTAEALGVPRKTFYDKLKRHGLQPEDYRS